ncbi:MAG: hypothetical protein LBR60_09390 [Fibrobacter sp.]|jgi:magnesium transporter|nr:hypothetical protein [Fibrobacter sp.]
MSLEPNKIPFWFRFERSGNMDEFQEACRKLELDPLIIEDMLNEQHLPKVEIYEHLVFLIARIFPNKDNLAESSMVCLILGERFVLSYEPGFAFYNSLLNPQKIPERASKNPESLFLLLFDWVVDSYLPLSTCLRRQADMMEEEALDQPEKDFSVRFQQLYKIIGNCRRAVSILHEDFMRLTPFNTPLISKSSQHILNDIQDHLRGSVQALETNASLLISTRGLYQDAVRQRQSEIIQHLTFITSIFIPLSFVTGVFGMNFANLPLLESPYGYLIVLIVMVLIAVWMWAFFKRRLKE